MNYSDPPVRVLLANVVTAERMEVLGNPTEFTESRAATYERHSVPGLDHRPMHYTGSDNAKLKMDFWVDQIIADERGGSFRLDAFANFMRALTVPAFVRGVPDTEPPSCVISWPNAIAIVAKLIALELKFTQFDSNGMPIQYTASCEFEEHRTARIPAREFEGR